MKRIILTCIAVFAVTIAFSQAVARDMVILEIGTGVTCTYCPGSAMGAADLLAAGCHVAVIEYHNYQPSSDPFSNADGTVSHVGGSASTSLYATYLPLYNQQHAVPSPLVIDIQGSNVGNLYTITLTITKLAAVTGTNLKAHLVLTESDIPYSWLGQTEVNDTERLMVPDASGTSISFSSGNTVTLTLSFTKDATWVTNNCELIAFVQDVSTKEIYNGTKKMLNALYLPLATDFSATPTSGCSPLTVNYTDLSIGATNWNWSFPGGTPATSTLQNPIVVYNAAGTYDVSLIASNPGGNAQGTMSKSAYISVTSVPGTAETPSGSNAMCLNPPNQNYTTGNLANTTGYIWDLIPTTAGTLTPSGTSCTIDWDNTFTGSAQLKVRGTNACGPGAWSNLFPINISVPPGGATTPAGPGSLCLNSPNTDYTTVGTAPATSYVWELVPADAGALYPAGTTVTIDWVNTFTGSCQLRVKPVNASCEGQWTNYLPITIETGPMGYNMTGGGAYCGQGGNGSPIGLDGSQTATNYTLYLNGTATTTIVPGTGSAISFGNQMTAGSYTAVANTSGAGCPNTMNGTIPVSIDPQVPEVPGDPMGPAQVYTGSTPTTDFTTTGGTYSTTYTWELSPASAGTFSGANTTATVSWNLTYAGTAIIRVQGVNSCGGGSFSNEFPVTVDVGVGISEPGQAKLISLFPNPAKGMVTLIPAKSITADILVRNSLGKTVLNKTRVTLSGNYQMNISELQAGIYFIRISSGDTWQTLKMIVE
jgi:PKD repeat protein